MSFIGKITYAGNGPSMMFGYEESFRLEYFFGNF